MDSLADRIALKALEDAPFDGWSAEALRRAAEACGQKPLIADALFPDGAAGAARHVSGIFDRLMMAKLKGTKIAEMRVRDRIALAVMTRLELMTPHRQGLKVMLSTWTNPMAAPRAAKTLWASANTIWAWAGDTATDYNRYTKRGLLAAVMVSTTLYWLQDTSPKAANTRAFLERRIENVLTIGRAIGRRKKAA